MEIFGALNEAYEIRCDIFNVDVALATCSLSLRMVYSSERYRFSSQGVYYTNDDTGS